MNKQRRQPPTRAAAASAEQARRRLLERYLVAHSIPGRLRLRPIAHVCRTMDADEKNLAEWLSRAFPGAKFAFSPGTGSVLVTYESSDPPHPGRATKKRGRRALETASPDASDYDSPVPYNPIPGKLRSYLYPRFVVFLIAALRSVRYIRKALKSLLRGRLNLDVLDGAALTVCFLQRDFKLLSSMVFFFALGEYLTKWTRKKSRTSLEESLALHIDHVWVRREGSEIRIPFAQACEGDEIVVRAGSALPVDGTIVAGRGMINQASLTGESMAVPRGPGASVYAGTVLEAGELVVKALKIGDGTRLHSIVKAIEDSENLKSTLQHRYELMADTIVPFNFLLSAATYVVTRNFRRAGSVLLVDYSCAIRLAAPLVMSTAMREAANNGLLIKGGKFVEEIAHADVVVFDKTGTLTMARPAVVNVIPFGGRDRRLILRLAACLEEHFVHPVGQAVVYAAEKENLQHREEHTKVEFIVAHGILSTWQGKKVRVGSGHFVLEHMARERRENAGKDAVLPLDDEQKAAIEREARRGRSILYLSIDEELAGIILIEDELREDAAAAVQALRDDGIARVIMLTGDDAKTAAGIAEQAGIQEFEAQMLPEDKAAYIRRLKAQGHIVAMVGDGVNDSLALSAAHVGIAMAEGTDVAREVADIVLTNGDLNGLLLARKIAREALARIRNGFHTSLCCNSVFLAGGLMGLLGPGASAFLHNALTSAIAVSSIRPFTSAVAHHDTTAPSQCNT
ncbi:MAG: heavy metal translocating P-type ATPase [Desulfovibrio sp.]|jgi:Cu2+-exporting ATPase|nr:heavy metal translocating P-type ATPase [Desulfovibrio sp.]